MTVKIQIKQKMKANARAALLSVLAVSVIVAGTVFLAARAEEDVSPSDAPCVDVPELSDNVTVADADTDQGTVAESPDNSEINRADDNEVHEVTVEMPELITADGIRDASAAPRRFKPGASYDGSFGSELNDEEKQIYQKFVNHFVTNQADNGDIVVDFTQPIAFIPKSYDEATGKLLDSSSLDNVNDIVLCAIAAFAYDYPDAFWVRSFSSTVSYRITDGTGYVERITMSSSASYPNAYTDRSKVQSGLRAAAAAVSQARSSESRYDTVKAVHDYICRNAEYDSLAAGISDDTDFYLLGASFTAAPVFGGGQRDKLFVCEGYAKAVKMLCGQFNIPCVLVSGSAGGPHMWNYVQMEDGKWYALDATWDDQSQIAYNYFLVGANTVTANKKTFSQDHSCSGYVMTTDTQLPMVYPTLSSEKYTQPVGDPSKITLTMLGASIRVSDPYGIRFGIKLKKDEHYRAAKNVKYGTLIIPVNVLGADDLTLETASAMKVEAKKIFSEDSSQLTFTGVLYNIPKSYFDRDIAARGYLTYEDDNGQQQVIYSETVQRSFHYVAIVAKDTYEGYQNPTETQKNVLEKLRRILSENGF